MTRSEHSSCLLGLQLPVRLCFLSHTKAHAEPSSESSANRRVSWRLSGDVHRIHRRARRLLPWAELLCAAGDTWSETISSGTSWAESSSTSSRTRILALILSLQDAFHYLRDIHKPQTERKLSPSAKIKRKRKLHCVLSGCGGGGCDKRITENSEELGDQPSDCSPAVGSGVALV